MILRSRIRNDQLVLISLQLCALVNLCKSHFDERYQINTTLGHYQNELFGNGMFNDGESVSIKVIKPKSLSKECVLLNIDFTKYFRI